MHLHRLLRPEELQREGELGLLAVKNCLRLPNCAGARKKLPFCLFARSLPFRQPPVPAWKSKTFWSSTSSGKRWADAQEGTGLVNLSLPLSERAASERRKQKSGRHLDTKKQQQQQQKYLP